MLDIYATLVIPGNSHLTNPSAVLVCGLSLILDSKDTRRSSVWYFESMSFDSYFCGALADSECAGAVVLFPVETSAMGFIREYCLSSLFNSGFNSVGRMLPSTNS